MRAVMFFYASLLIGGLLLSGCGHGPVAGGTSTSENGRVVGKIVTTDGASGAQTQVMLVSSAYDPWHTSATILTDTTDASGMYGFSGVAPGKFKVQSVNIVSRTRALSREIQVADDTIVVPDATLAKPGAIRIGLPERNDTATAFVYIPGTTMYAEVTDDSSVAVIDSVPAGTIPAVFYFSAGKPEVMRYAVNVVPEATATIYNPGWKFSRRLRINTAASGAQINDALYRFPLLIRLDERSFNFSEAQSNGGDCRFSKDDGAVLHCEIERWDSRTGRAELWVNIDTIYGNSADRFITMYWGNADVLSSSGIVFDTADGFAGVWHLQEKTDTAHDATVNRYHGERIGGCRQAAGLIGDGVYFDTAESYVEMGNVLNTEQRNLTISAWVKRTASGLQTIIAKSDGGSPSSAYGWSLSFGLADQVHFFAATGGASWGSSGAFDIWANEDSVVTDSIAWHYVAVVIDRADGKKCRLYLDGVDITGGSNGDIAKVGSLVNSVPLRIGVEADGDYQWTGAIDECVVSHAVRSASWIRLCYLNQRQDGLIVGFE